MARRARYAAPLRTKWVASKFRCRAGRARATAAAVNALPISRDTKTAGWRTKAARGYAAKAGANQARSKSRFCVCPVRGLDITVAECDEEIAASIPANRAQS